MNQSFFIKTYGCQMNEYDSEKLNDLLEYNGYKASKNFEESDIAILNTCHIRKKSVREVVFRFGEAFKI